MIIFGAKKFFISKMVIKMVIKMNFRTLTKLYAADPKIEFKAFETQDSLSIARELNIGTDT